MAVKTKISERLLMRQRVNATPALLKLWVDNYKFDIRNIIHGSLLKESDLGTTFEHQDRTFKIIGMGESRLVMLEEITEEGTFHWECTRHFVQLKLERYNQQFVYFEGHKKSQLIDMPYDMNQLLLAPLKTRRKIKPIEEIETIEETESFEDYADEIENEEPQTDIF
jgi:hypothetical protein